MLARDFGSIRTTYINQKPQFPLHFFVLFSVVEFGRAVFVERFLIGDHCMRYDFCKLKLNRKLNT